MLRGRARKTSRTASVMASEAEAEGRGLAGRLPPPLLCSSFGAVYKAGYIASPSLLSILLHLYVNIAFKCNFVDDDFGATATSDPRRCSSISTSVQIDSFTNKVWPQDQRLLV